MWKQPRRPSGDGWAGRLRSVQPAECYPVLRRNALSSREKTRENQSSHCRMQEGDPKGPNLCGSRSVMFPKGQNRGSVKIGGRQASM